MIQRMSFDEVTDTAFRQISFNYGWNGPPTFNIGLLLKQLHLPNSYTLALAMRETPGEKQNGRLQASLSRIRTHVHPCSNPTSLRWASLTDNLCPR